MDKNRINYYLDIAEVVSERSTCLKRQYGAVLVKNNEIISTGYNGSPRGRDDCIKLHSCLRTGVPRGQQYQLCRSVHAEQNAIISASRSEMIGADLYLTGKEVKSNDYIDNPAPCIICKKLIINAGIKRVFVRLNKKEFRCFVVEEWLQTDSKENYMGY